MLCGLNLECGAAMNMGFCLDRATQEGRRMLYSDPSSAASPSSQRKHEQIETDILKDSVAHERTLKILILGGAESGKSTIFKQMRILHMAGFNEADVINYRCLIHANVVEALLQLINGADRLHIRFSPAEERDVTVFRSMEEAERGAQNLDPERAALIRRLWSSKPIAAAFARRSTFALLDSAKYFLDKVEEVSVGGYRPTEQDILRARIPTIGINEICFDYRKAILRLVDVGGQKSEQRKWIHCFDKVNGILFIVDIAGYDLVVADDPLVNRVQNSLDIFDRLLRTPYFVKTAMILFMNKVDIFKEKIATVPLTAAFPDYAGLYD